jgi:SAM-dependent methyltransferase
VHEAAYQFVERVLAEHPVKPDAWVLDIGAFDVNGTVRPLFAGVSSYVGIDVRSGPGVDVEIDPADYDGDECYDLVVSTETLEHMSDPEKAIDCAFRALKPGGLLILTLASPTRAPHGIGGGAVGQEYYAGITPGHLAELLSSWAGVKIEHHPERGDLYATATKPRRKGKA